MMECSSFRFSVSSFFFYLTRAYARLSTFKHRYARPASIKVLAARKCRIVSANNTKKYSFLYIQIAYTGFFFFLCSAILKVVINAACSWLWAGMSSWGSITISSGPCTFHNGSQYEASRELRFPSPLRKPQAIKLIPQPCDIFRDPGVASAHMALLESKRIAL